MSNQKQHQLQQMIKMLGWKKSNSFYAEKLGITEQEVISLIKEIKHKLYRTSETKKVNNEKGTIESVVDTKFEPKTDLELAKLHRIDLTKYKISHYYSKLQTNGHFTSTVLATLKKPDDYSQEDFAKFLTKFVPKNITITKVRTDIDKEFIDVELSLSDYHLAKKQIDGDNDPKTRTIRYYQTAVDLIKKVRSIYNIDTIVFPISNDFFHTDNIQNQTTNGTPQDTMIDYHTEYEIGFAILVDTINMLRSNGNTVKVVLVQGNHDRTKSFYLAHALQIFFKDNFDVEFIREHSTIKGVTLGNTFIGWHHGNCKLDDLPLLFATSPKYCQQFGNALYREVHTGDKHHYMAKEIKGVRIQQMPSLSGTDRWHEDNNFVNSIRAALVLMYNKETGKTGEFEVRI